MPPLPLPVPQPPPTSLLEAVWLDDINSVRLLLYAGADTEERDTTFGETPLIRAARYGFLDMVSLLLDNGAKIDSRNLHGDTALTLVSGSYIANRDAMIRLLLDRGADVDNRNHAGQTALSMALQRRHPAHTINMLKEATATRQRLAKEFTRAAEAKRIAEEERRADFSARQDWLKEIARKRPKPPKAT